MDVEVKPKTLADRLWSKVTRTRPNECWPWRGKRHCQGYGIMKVTNSRREILTHRAAWLVTHGSLSDSSCVLHKCDNRLCCNPSHLFLGSRTDNAKDRDSKNRTAKGERHGNHKLTEQDVIEIRRRFSEKRGMKSAQKIADDFGINWRNVYFIVQGRAWSCVAINHNQGPEPVPARVQ